jgi:hypothetical protein
MKAIMPTIQCINKDQYENTLHKHFLLFEVVISFPLILFLVELLVSVEFQYGRDKKCLIGWKPLLYFSAILLFRLEGKETISMMRSGQVVITIGIASILIEPLKSKSIWGSIYSAALLIVMSIAATYVHLYFPKVGRWLLGQPIILIKNGQFYNQI